MLKVTLTNSYYNYIHRCDKLSAVTAGLQIDITVHFISLFAAPRLH